MNCLVCPENNTAKYKCPKCRLPYCSVSCWNKHKAVDCSPPPENKTEPEYDTESSSLYNFPTEDTVELEKLRLLENNQELKNILCNRHLRDLLVSIDQSPNPAAAMQHAMLEPIFVEFADECLKVKMQREEKQLEAALDAIISRVNDLKYSIGSMVAKLENEYETLNWPQFLDNFAVISGQLTALSKMLAHDKSPPLRNLTVLPLHLTPDRDEELVRLTEHRIPAFSHAIVPDYLRTKLDPEIEHKMQILEQKAVAMTLEQYQKQCATYTKVVTQIWEAVSKMREEWESEGGSRGGAAQTSSVADTHALVAAVAMGKGLKPLVPQGVQQNVPGGMMVAPVGPPGGPMNPNQPGMGPMGKAPSSIKTNIKAAPGIHPYSR